MSHFLLNKRLIILLICIIILVSLIGFSLRDKENITRPEQLVKDVVGFGQSLISVPVQGIVDFYDNIQDMKNVYIENQKLKARLERLATLEKQVYDLKKDNEELRTVLNKMENLRSYSTIQATVISRNPERWNDRITINKGEQNGVKLNMAVMSGTGLIGRVVTTSEFTATVELLSSENQQNRVSALIQGDEPIYGLINGFDREEKLLLMKDIPMDKEVKAGQNVVTSGLGGVFPKALDIGQVKRVEVDRYGLTQIAYVEPSANFYDLEHVIVIERLIEEESLADEGEEE